MPAAADVVHRSESAPASAGSISPRVSTEYGEVEGPSPLGKPKGPMSPRAQAIRKVHPRPADTLPRWLAVAHSQLRAQALAHIPVATRLRAIVFNQARLTQCCDAAEQASLSRAAAITLAGRAWAI
jgi:hypothetical protein